MNIQVTVNDPKFQIKERVQLWRNNALVTITERVFVADKVQTIRKGEKLLGYWEYFVKESDEIFKESDLHYPSPNPMRYTVKDSRTHKILHEGSTLQSACDYIMKHDTSDGWYDMDICYNGFNDIHVLDAIDALLIVAAYHKQDTDAIMEHFRYRLNGNTIYYCQDYEIAYDLAQIITMAEDSKIRQILVS